MSSPALLKQLSETDIPAAMPEPASPTVPARPPIAIGAMVARWYRLNKEKLRATLIGAISLAAFLFSWYLLTKYHVVFFVRFTNVPAPVEVYGSFTRS